MLADLLRSLSNPLANQFIEVPAPVALTLPGRRPRSPTLMNVGEDERFTPDLIADPHGRIAILVGPFALLDPDGLHRIAHHLGAPVANTWGAKGIYPWNSPHHMGTGGLQRDDFALLGLADFDLVLTIGIDSAETSPPFPSAARIFHLPDGLRPLVVPGAPRPFVPIPNDLFTRISAIAQPGYVDDAFPRHPARAVMDLKQSLGESTRVTAQPGPVGLWIARTFPTDRMGSVIVPAYDRPGIGAAVGLVSAAQGTETVCVVAGPIDATTHEALHVARHHGFPLRLEVWEDDVNWNRTEDLIAVAGPVVAWT